MFDLNGLNHKLNAVKLLKNILADAPVLMFPDYNKPFHLHTDASNTGIGAVLLQEHNGKLHPLSYYSKTLNEAQRNYSTTKREALALVQALTHFRNIILTFKINVYTDHKPLLGVLTNNTSDATINRWGLLIQDYAINLHYLNGNDNPIADSLSRLPIKECENFETNLLEQLNEKNEHIRTITEFIPEKLPWSAIQLRERAEKRLKLQRNNETIKKQI